MVGRRSDVRPSQAVRGRGPRLVSPAVAQGARNHGSAIRGAHRYGPYPQKWVRPAPGVNDVGDGARGQRFRPGDTDLFGEPGRRVGPPGSLSFRVHWPAHGASPPDFPCERPFPSPLREHPPGTPWPMAPPGRPEGPPYAPLSLPGAKLLAPSRTRSNHGDDPDFTWMEVVDLDPSRLKEGEDPWREPHGWHPSRGGAS